MRYYVDYSSVFDKMSYDIDLIKRAVKELGGHNIRTAKLMGWLCQPEVVTFNANDKEVTQITDGLNAALNTQWIIVREKDW